ncbi:MAG: hypothetical protein LLG08_02135 [Actinomycetia bacterium]|nr:hypothetical protein [Actinomycetes bacterium]
MSKASFDLSLAAGQSGKGELYVLNDGDETLTVMVYAADQVVDSKGDITYSVPNRDKPGTETGAASWVQFQLPASTKAINNTPYLVLEPGDRVKLNFEVNVPAQSPPGDHQALLFFEMFDLKQALEGTGSTIGGRIGARLRVRVKGDLVERMDIKPFVADGLVIGDALRYTFVVRNDGNIDKLINVTAALLDSSENDKLKSEVVTDTSVYAGTTIERQGVLGVEGLIGKYTLRLTGEYPREGGTSTLTDQIVKDRTVWIFPWWLAISAVAILGMLLIYASWRQAVKTAERHVRVRRDATPTPQPGLTEDPGYWTPADAPEKNDPE